MNSLVRLSLNYKSFSLRSVQISQYLKSGQRIRHLQSSAKPRQAVGLRKGKDTRLILEHEYAVKEDTLLFRYENKNYVRFVNIFAICQLVFWTHLSYSAFSYMKDIPVSEDDKENKDLPFWRKINLGKFRTGITAGCILVGWGALGIAWMYTLRNVRFLVLKKGGDSLLIVTYSPFLRNKSLTVPLKEVSAKHSRLSCKVHLPLKVKGKPLHYMLDMRGEFLNTKLFDYSAGLQRNWTK